MNAERLKSLQIAPSEKRRSKTPLVIIFLGVILASSAAVFVASPWSKDKERIKVTGTKPPTNSPSQSATANPGSGSNNIILTVSGYIINRERIEISPRFLGLVKWIGIRKGDAVTNGQVVVLLDDTEYKARLQEAEGRLAAARANLDKAELDYARVTQLARTDIESKKAQDDARLQVAAAQADVKQMEGTVQLARIYLDWTVIRSPIDGVVLERLVNANELVVPQSFGGGRGPSTALVAVADPKDLQVEIDMNEADLSKVYLNQKCRVSPEAYPEKIYQGQVAEIAPQANRSKGTLEIKVQIINPDQFLTPELSAKVEFLK